MDAAAAARMSDPQLNPHFRRRWREPAGLGTPETVVQIDAAARRRLERLAELLRAEWRRRRDEHGLGGAS
jgi:hypothetical protein